MERITLTIVALALTTHLGTAAAQVLNDWYDHTGLVTDMSTGTLSEDDFAADGIFSNWDSLLKDMQRDEKASRAAFEKEIEQVRGSGVSRGETDVYDKAGNRYVVPRLVADDGCDLFLLTTEGIHVYMALDAPVYFQEIDDEIVRWIRYYAYRKKSNTRRMFVRYASWEAPIKDFFRTCGVPAELAELCLVESGCTYKALSSAGALGMWQIMPETGRRFGLRVDDTVDERLDPVLSTHAAAKILNANYKRTGEWTLAAAAYNCGAGRITKHAATRKYWPQIKPVLPKETQQYISCLIAIHYVWTYREKLALA